MAYYILNKTYIIYGKITRIIVREQRIEYFIQPVQYFIYRVHNTVQARLHVLIITVGFILLFLIIALWFCRVQQVGTTQQLRRSMLLKLTIAPDSVESLEYSQIDRISQLWAGITWRIYLNMNHKQVHLVINKK